MAFAEGHALVIGVGQYQAPGWSAPITVGDATGVRDALIDEKVAGYPAGQVGLLHDEGAVLEAVNDAFADLAARATADDVVLIFFAGHGVPGDDGQYTLATHDTQFSPGKLALQGTGLGEPALLAALLAIKARKLLFVINACLSGEIHATLGAESAPPTPALSARVLASGEGRAVITAARATQSSYYRPQAPTTLFGQALIDGLRGKGMDRPGYVGLFELYEYLYKTVIAGAAELRVAQEPVLNLSEGVGPFAVSFFGDGIVDRSALGAPAIRQSLPDGAVETFPVAVVEKTSVVSFEGATIGSVTMGDVAGRDIVKITTTPAAAAAVTGRADLLAAIAGARADVAGLAAPAAQKGRQEDAADDLRKAKEAGDAGDDRRMLEKLDSAQRALLAMGAPETLSDAVGVLLQRARTHG